MTAPDYLAPDVPAGLARVRMPVVTASDASLAGYGRLLDAPEQADIEIVRWPARGWRQVDTDSGDEGGVREGVFEAEWHGDVLYGRNSAVGGHYVLGYGTEPAAACEDHARPPSSLLLWHANYHPDGGQLFFPLDAAPFVVPLALPGDDVRPEHFVCFAFDGTRGLYIHPDVWHEGVFALAGRQRFWDRQGAVHARISVDFAREFGCLLEAPLDDLPVTVAAGHGTIPPSRSTTAMAKGFKDYVAAANAVVETLDVDTAAGLVGNDDVQFIDVRDGNEVAASGTLPGAVHASRGMLEFKIDPASPMHEPAFASGKRLVFYCGTGGRSALAAKLAMDMGLARVAHMAGGFKAWTEAGQDVTPSDA